MTRSRESVCLRCHLVSPRSIIFPGFIRLSGSSARLIARMTSSDAPCSASRYFILPMPTPCSPVQVPPIASARSDQPLVQPPRLLDLAPARRDRARTSGGSCRRPRGRRGRWETARRRCRFSVSIDALGEPRDRHADVGRPRRASPGRSASAAYSASCRACHSCSRSSRRVAHSKAACRRARPRAPARLRLVGDVARAVAVEFEEQRRRDRVSGLRIPVDRVHLRLVEQLDARDRHAELNRGDDGVDRALDRIERADRRRHRLGQRDAAARHLGDDAERALRPTNSRVRS